MKAYGGQSNARRTSSSEKIEVQTSLVVVPARIPQRAVAEMSAAKVGHLRGLQRERQSHTCGLGFNKTYAAKSPKNHHADPA